MNKSSKTTVNSMVKSFNLGGLLFVHPKLEYYKGLQAWVDAGKPNNVLIYDTVTALTSAGIPIVDAHKHFGLWIRLPKLLKNKPCKVRIVEQQLVLDSKIVNTIDYISFSNPQKISDKSKLYR